MSFRKMMLISEEQLNSIKNNNANHPELFQPTFLYRKEEELKKLLASVTSSSPDERILKYRHILEQIISHLHPEISRADTKLEDDDLKSRMNDTDLQSHTDVPHDMINYENSSSEGNQEIMDESTASAQATASGTESSTVSPKSPKSPKLSKMTNHQRSKYEILRHIERNNGSISQDSKGRLCIDGQPVENSNFDALIEDFSNPYKSRSHLPMGGYRLVSALFNTGFSLEKLGNSARRYDFVVRKWPIRQ